MNKLKILTIFLFSSSLISQFALASDSDSVDSKTILKYMPASINVKGKGIGVSADSIQTTFRQNSRQPKYSIIKYLNMETSCEIVVLKKDGKNFIPMDKTVVKYPNELAACDELQLIDLNGDGELELVVSTMKGVRDVGSPVFLKWDGRKLVDITPVKTVDSIITRDFREVAISTERVQNKLIIYDYDRPDSSSGKRIFEMSNGEVRLVGSYDLVSFLTVEQQELKPSFAAEGQYTLTVKNVSNHNRPVRAEVTVNGSVVLKPQDFCSAPAHPKNDKGWWGGHDDDDDQNFDNCKRCVPKSEVYAIVNMKTANEIKVKVYGMKDSKIQLTLVKK